MVQKGQDRFANASCTIRKESCVASTTLQPSIIFKITSQVLIFQPETTWIRIILVSLEMEKAARYYNVAGNRTQVSRLVVIHVCQGTSHITYTFKN